MNFIDVYIEEKLRQWYLKIFQLNDANRKYVNKHIEYAKCRDKIRIFKVIISLKIRYGLDFSDDEIQIKKIQDQQKQILQTVPYGNKKL